MFARRHTAVCLAASIVLVPVCRAQKLSDLTAGARVRVTGDRATNTGIEHFSMAGAVVAADSTYLVLRQDSGTGVDTLALFGVRRLELFQGTRSRRDMVFTGTLVGAAIGVSSWLLARALIGSNSDIDVTDDSGNTSPRRSVPTDLKRGIPVLAAAGALVGAVIGRDHWVRIGVPSSVFPQAR